MIDTSLSAPVHDHTGASEAAAVHADASVMAEAGMDASGVATRRLAATSLLQRLETLARTELERLAAGTQAGPTLVDPLLAGLYWDMGLDGRQALEADGYADRG
ncbi:hypothetical protein [Stenotrophomonas sp. Marseille-Q4652]|uniref:hypothetical protein n=1 Tax=Stenotrophomonas sp. Marseille-Q4652 TaxID=2866595 RepID=UPI001CE44DA5|nr:hypothetical protein [Stenotrophomonas sp. Marseille-Q4652]